MYDIADYADPYPKEFIQAMKAKRQCSDNPSIDFFNPDQDVASENYETN